MQPDLKLGCLLIVTDTLDTTPLPLEHTAVVGKVSGPLAQVSVTQRFGNPFRERLNLEYLFPLPHEAAVVDYEIRIGGRTIKAEIKEAAAAKKTFEEAIEDGKRASLLEQRRPNLFAVQIGNVQPGETILATIRYEERLSYEDGHYTFVFPMGITPRYHQPAYNGAQAAKVTAPVIDPKAGAHAAPVELTLNVDVGVAAGDPISPSHTFTLTRQSERQFALTLSGSNIANKDFTLRYPVTAAAVTAAAWLSQAAEGDIALITLLPPAFDSKAEADPREFVFVIDRSGSMSGGPMEQAKNALRACLRALGPKDTFAIQAFDDKIEWFHAGPQPVTQGNIDSADQWLNSIDARGGTEIIPALEGALKPAADPERLRYVVFLTDGAVSAEETAYKRISAQRGKARIFTFGIGPSVNRALLAKMATLGRGAAEFLRVTDDIETAITRFQDRVSFPALLDIQVNFEGAEAWDMYPADLPDLYVGQPLEIITRLKRAGKTPAKLTVQGTRADKRVSMAINLPPATETNLTLGRLWARKRIESLHDSQFKGGDEEKIRAATISLSLDYRLITSYTSFVAVDSEVLDKSTASRNVQVSVPLPDGLDYEGFFGEPPGSNVPHGLAGGVTGLARTMLSFAAPPPMVDQLLPNLAEDWASSPATPPGMQPGMPQSAPAPSSLAAPAMRRTAAPKKAAEPPKPEASEPAQPALNSIADRIKWLARTQNADGSWGKADGHDGHDAQIEMTAAALLAFVRAGHTTRIGNYRRQIQKTADWLTAALPKATGFAQFAAARALSELESAIGGTQTFTASGKPTTAAEKAAAAPDSVTVPATIANLDDLRIAALVNGEAQLAAAEGLAIAWMAVGKRGK